MENKKIKRYIDQEAWVDRLREEMETTKYESRRIYLNVLINSILCQPTIDIEVDD